MLKSVEKKYQGTAGVRRASVRLFCAVFRNGVKLSPSFPENEDAGGKEVPGIVARKATGGFPFSAMLIMRQGRG